MGKIIDRFTEPWEANAPTYRYDEDTDRLEYLITVADYVECEDRLSSCGCWLFDAPTITRGWDRWVFLNNKENFKNCAKEIIADGTVICAYCDKPIGSEKDFSGAVCAECEKIVNHAIKTGTVAEITPWQSKD